MVKHLVRLFFALLPLIVVPSPAAAAGAGQAVYALARWDAANLKWRATHEGILRNIRPCGNYLFVADVEVGGVVRKMTGFAFADKRGGVAELVLRSRGLRIWGLADEKPPIAYRYKNTPGAEEADGYIIGLPPAEFEKFRFACLKFNPSRAI